MYRLSIIFILLLGFSPDGLSQYIGIYSTDNNSQLETEGPVYTLSNVAMKKNTDRTDPDGGPLTVTASYSQSLGSISGAGANHNALMFGGQSNGTKVLGTKQALVPFNDIANPSAGYYVPIPGQNDMSTVSHYAFEQYASVEFFQDQVTEEPKPAYPTLGTHKMGEITYTFSKPVMNPVLHVTGLGGIFSSSKFGVCLFSVRYGLKEVVNNQTARSVAATLDRLDGTSRFIVSGGDISNNFSQADFDAVGSTAQGVTGDNAGTGSVLVNTDGDFVTSVTFEVFMDGKTPLVNGISSNWTSVPADSIMNQRYSGDRFNTSWTLLESSILPITLTSFESFRADGDCGSMLKWSTSAELDASHMNVEISANGIDFRNVARVPARGSNSEYSFEIQDVEANKFARLKLVDIYGGHDYSEIIVLEANCPSNFVSAIFPNPVQQHQYLYYEYQGRSKGAYFGILDVTGKLVGRQYKETSVDQRMRLQFSLQGLHPGTYFLVDPEGNGQKFMIIN